MVTVEDDGPHLRPEFIPVVHTIYTEMSNLRSGEEVVIIADSRTPANVVNAFFGEALSFGASVQALLVKTPPPPSVQTSIVWSKTIAAATTAADLIVDLRWAMRRSWPTRSSAGPGSSASATGRALPICRRR